MANVISFPKRADDGQSFLLPLYAINHLHSQLVPEAVPELRRVDPPQVKNGAYSQRRKLLGSQAPWAAPGDLGGGGRGENGGDISPQKDAHASGFCQVCRELGEELHFVFPSTAMR